VRGLAAVVERIALAADALTGLPRAFPAPYFDTWIGLARARAVISAERLGVFSALPGTTDEIALRCGVEPDRLEVLLGALRALRYTRQRGRRWHPTRRTRNHFGPNAPRPMGATVGELAARNWEALTGLEEVLRGGQPAGLHELPADDPTWDGYQAAMTELAPVSAKTLLDAMPTAPLRILDIGGGPGTVAIAAARRWPECEVTIMELEPAAMRGRERLAATGLADRVRYVVDEAAAPARGEEFDVAVVANVLHNLGRTDAIELLARAASMARRVIVLELDGTSTQVSALASLSFCAWMGSRTFESDELTAMVSSAGIREVEIRRPPGLPGSIVLSGRGLPPDRRRTARSRVLNGGGGIRTLGGP
jgi:precorrin-6B methylase 2